MNPQDPQFLQNPYPSYRQIQQQPGLALDANGSLLVSRYAEVRSVLGDKKFGHNTFWSEEGKAWLEQNPAAEMQTHWMLLKNPPDHRRLRRLVETAFTPAKIRALEPRIEALTRELLEGLKKKSEFDLMSEFAIPLPVTVIAELLGIPETDRSNFKDWADALAPTLEMGNLSPEQMNAANHAAANMRQYLHVLAERRRLEPQDDLISALVRAEAEGDNLSLDELYGTCHLLLIAGHETTTNLIGNGMLALLQNPEQLEQLRKNPALLENAIEELLRFDAPVQFTSRMALEDTEVGGVALVAGSWVTLMLGAANRDPLEFGNPDALELKRVGVRPLSFGHGIHFCLGAPLARTEARAAFRALLELETLELGGKGYRYKSLLTLRGLEHLHLQL